MNLSRLLVAPERFIQPVPQEVLEEESDEPELILESYLQIALTLMNSLDLVQGQINTVSELIDQKLDTARNRILFANMLISVCTLCVTAASLVGSYMGMNLNNHIQEDPNAFIQVVFGSIGAAFVLGLLIMWVLVYSGTMTTRTQYSGG
jgi:magnesium transporter